MKSIFAAIALSLLLSACYNSERSETTINTTFGQELTDLKTALDSGAIDQQQYKKMINRLADRRLHLNLDDGE
jgi:PBP1b-binding outer membrane lipoprotein LpoB